jgi:hypothetical protein
MQFGCARRGCAVCETIPLLIIIFHTTDFHTFYSTGAFLEATRLSASIAAQGPTVWRQ